MAFLVKLALALKTYGTNDVYAYDQFSTWSRYLGVELYHVDPLFNHPPSMIYLLHTISWLAGATRLPFQFWLRLPGILADAANLWIVWKLLGDRVTERSVFWSLILLAAAPTLILISGFHGNTDSLVIFFLLLAIYLVERGASAWAVGAAFGLAHCIKIFPAIAGPLLLLHLARRGRKLKFCAAAGAVLMAAWSPFIFQDPRAVIGNVFGYRSVYGQWGLSYLVQHLAAVAPGFEPVDAAFKRFGTYLALGLVLWFSWRLNRAQPTAPLFAQTGFLFFLFLSVSSGFGVQYLAWLAPWVVSFGLAPAAVFFSASGVFLFLVYHFWAQGFPWYLADGYDVGFTGYLDHAQLLCWISVLVVLWVAGSRLLPIPAIAAHWRWAAACAAAAALYAIVPPQKSWPKPSGDKFDSHVRSVNAQSFLDLASALSARGRYAESIETARRALELAPDAADEAVRIIGMDEAALGK